MIFLLCCLLVNFAQAEVVTEEMIKRSILQNFPLIEEAELKLSSAKEEVTAAQGTFDTKLKVKHRNHIEKKYDNDYTEAYLEKLTPFSGIKLQAGHRRGNGLFAPYEGKYDTSPEGEAFAAISLPLLRGRSIDDARFQEKVAGLEKKISGFEVNAKKNLYVFKGVSTFLKWRLSHQVLETQKSLLQIAEERQKMLEKRHALGDVERIKIKDNERSVLKRTEEVLKAEAELIKYALDLSLYYRDESGKQIDLLKMKPAIAIVPSTLKTIEYQKLPQLQMLNLEIEKNKELNKLYDNQRLPALNLDLGSSKELSPKYAYDPQRLYVAFSFEIPFENRKATGKSVSTEYKKMALEKQKQWAESEFFTLYKQSQNVAMLALERIKLGNRELENANLLADAERKRWRSGDSDLFTVALREQETADVEIRLWKSHYELNQAILESKLYGSLLVE